MNIQEFRQKYPDYNDLSDKALADKFHKKHYSDMDKAVFDERFLGTAEPRGPRGVTGSFAPTPGEYAVGALETVGTLATGLAAFPTSGIAGLAGLPFGKGEEWHAKTAELLTHAPITPAAQELTEKAMFPFEKIAESAQWWGDLVYEKTANPDLAAATASAIEASVYLVALPKIAHLRTKLVRSIKAGKAPEIKAAVNEINKIQIEEAGLKPKEPLELKLKKEPAYQAIKPTEKMPEVLYKEKGKTVKEKLEAKIEEKAKLPPEKAKIAPRIEVKAKEVEKLFDRDSAGDIVVYQGRVEGQPIKSGHFTFNRKRAEGFAKAKTREGKPIVDLYKAKDFPESTWIPEGKEHPISIEEYARLHQDLGYIKPETIKPKYTGMPEKLEAKMKVIDREAQEAKAKIRPKPQGIRSIITDIVDEGGLYDKTLPGELRDLVQGYYSKFGAEKFKAIPKLINKETGKPFDEMQSILTSERGHKIVDTSEFIELIDKDLRAIAEGKAENRVTALTDEALTDRMWADYTKEEMKDGISEGEAKRTLEREIADEIAKENEFAKLEREAIQSEYRAVSEEVKPAKKPAHKLMPFTEKGNSSNQTLMDKNGIIYEGKGKAHIDIVKHFKLNPDDITKVGKITQKGYYDWRGPEGTIKEYKRMFKKFLEVRRRGEPEYEETLIKEPALTIEEFKQTQKPPFDKFKTYAEKIKEYRKHGDEKIMGAATGNMLADKVEAQAATFYRVYLKSKSQETLITKEAPFELKGEEPPPKLLGPQGKKAVMPTEKIRAATKGEQKPMFAKEGEQFNILDDVNKRPTLKQEVKSVLKSEKGAVELPVEDLRKIVENLEETQFVKGVKTKGARTLEGVSEAFHSPDAVYRRDPKVGSEIYRLIDTADQKKNAFLVTQSNAFIKACGRIKEGSKTSEKIGQVLDGKLKRSALNLEEGKIYDFMKEKYDFLIQKYARTVTGTEESYLKVLRAVNRKKPRTKEWMKELTQGEREAYDVLSRKIKEYLPHIFDKDALLEDFRAEVFEVEGKLRLATHQPTITQFKSRIKELNDAIIRLEKGYLVTYESLPRNVRFRFFESRKGKAGYSFDAVKAYQTYLAGISKKIYDEPAIRRVAELHKKLDPSLKPYNKWYIRRYMGWERHKLDDLAGAIASLQWMRTLGVNPRSAIVNLTQRMNTVVEVGETWSVKGETFGFTKEGKRLFDETGIAKEVPTVLMEGTVPEGMERVRAIVGYMFNKVELGNRRHAFLSAYLKGKKKMGMSEEKAIRYGIDTVHKTQFRYGKVGMPRVLTGPVGRLALQFWSYPIKQIELLTTWARNNPLRVIKFIAYAEGGNYALNRFLNIDLSNALGFGITWGEALQAIQAVPEGDWKGFFRHLRLTFSGGGGLLPSGLGPTATGVGKVIKGVSEGGGVAALTREITPVEAKRVYQAYRAIKNRHDGKYPIFDRRDHLMYYVTSKDLVMRTIGPMPASDSEEYLRWKRQSLLERERKEVLEDITRAIVENDMDKANKLISKYQVVPTQKAIENEILKRKLTYKEREQIKGIGKKEIYRIQRGE